MTNEERSRAQASRAAIERLYIAMRHLFIRGSYKPSGMSGRALVDALMMLRPEIYGSIAESERVELNGLLYIFQRLPKGIEQCRFIKLISREGFENAGFKPLVAPKRRRNCYRIDEEQLFIEVTRGRSDIYDILTHLTFMFIEADKIRRNSIDAKGNFRREWLMLERIVEQEKTHQADINYEVAFTYLSTLLGRTYAETVRACQKFGDAKEVNSIFSITYWLGKRSMEEHAAGNTEENQDREISFSSALRARIGHHQYADHWANNIQRLLIEKQLMQRPIHIISSNMHSVLNWFYASAALAQDLPDHSFDQLAAFLSNDANRSYRRKVKKTALNNGMSEIRDDSGVNLEVQVFDTKYLQNIASHLPDSFQLPTNPDHAPVLIVMDYAFGEQAFEAMDELLKPYTIPTTQIGNITTTQSSSMNVQSISIMGKAGILEGKRGDIMIPNAHIFEGTADNYPFKNDLSIEDFDFIDQQDNVVALEGPMITVLGTSLQNKDILRFFHQSSWGIIGLEMEGAHYQKAIQAAAKIRNNINQDVTVRYAYYASDNPLESGQTLASGSLGLVGVKPTYLITKKILEKILDVRVERQ